MKIIIATFLTLFLYSLLLVVVTSLLYRAEAAEPIKRISNAIRRGMAVPKICSDWFFGEGQFKHSVRSNGGYVWCLWALYSTFCAATGMAFPPAETRNLNRNNDDFHMIGIAFIFWVAVKVAADVVSLRFTKNTIDLVLTSEQNREIYLRLVLDLFVAAGCFIVTQSVSNILFSIQVQDASNWFQYLINWKETAFQLYSLNIHDRDAFLFPGQLVVSFTTYIPSLIALLLIWVSIFHRSLTILGAAVSKAFSKTYGHFLAVMAFIVTVGAFIFGIWEVALG